MHFRKSSAWALVLVAACVASACATSRYEFKSDAPEPPARTAVVDFTPLLTFTGLSRTVYTEPIERGLMTRVLLSPNLVFESSRSSLLDPDTVGPERVPGSPDLPNALGRAVQISESSTLMKYLAGKGSVLIAPAVTRRWGTEWGCTAADPSTCPKATWVERLILMKQALARGSQGVDEEAVRQAPTSMLAVRDLGTASKTMSVVVERQAGAGGKPQYVVRARKSPDEVSLCPGMQLDVPLVWFSAEILSMQDGRILARIDEQRMPKLAGDFRYTIATARYEPVRSVDVAPQPNHACASVVPSLFPHQGSREYTSSWTEVDVACTEIQRAFAGVIKSLGGQLSDPSIVLEVVRTSLDPLYR